MMEGKKWIVVVEVAQVARSEQKENNERAFLRTTCLSIFEDHIFVHPSFTNAVHYLAVFDLFWVQIAQGIKFFNLLCTVSFEGVL